MAWLILRAVKQRGLLPRLDEAPPPSEQAPRIAVIVPARNEEANIGRCLDRRILETKKRKRGGAKMPREGHCALDRTYLLFLVEGVRRIPHGSTFWFATGARFSMALYASSLAFSSAFFLAVSAFWRSDSGKFSCA